jgi:SAM-dependent methyltransferase
LLSLDPKIIVAEGYDRVAERYLQWSAGDEVRSRMLRRLTEMLPPLAAVLDLGCGSGVPVAAQLSQLGHRVVGVDIAARQVALARRNVPAGRFVHGDMMDVELQPASFDAVTAFFAITHIPRAEHALLLRRIFSWLRPGGLFVGSFGAHETNAVENDWLGVPMFFSHFDAATNRRLVGHAGFEFVRDEVLVHDEDGRLVQFLWIVARRPVDVSASNPVKIGP